MCHRNTHKQLLQEKHSYLFNGLCWDDGDRHPHCSCADHHRFSCGILSIISYHREASMYAVPDKHYDKVISHLSVWSWCWDHWAVLCCSLLLL